MKFPHSFLEDEVRSGYYVPGEMKAAWAVQLDVLEQIDRICKKYNITYYAEFGTLLGAVRHNGCIPWDDDFDISMKRQDLAKFIAVCREELPEEYAFLSFREENPEYWQFIYRVINMDKMSTKKVDLERNHGLVYTGGIDIFCLDNEPTDETGGKILGILASFVQTVAGLLDNPDIKFEAIVPGIKSIEDLTGQKIDREANIKQQLYVLTDNLFAMYSGDESDYITIMPNWIDSDHQYKFPKSYYDDVVWMPFENTKVPVPVGYDFILRQKYGDYMRLVKASGSHDYPYYNKQEAVFKEVGEKLYYEYEFDPKALNAPANRDKNRSPKQQALAFMDMLCGLHDNLSSLVENKMINEALQFMASIQEAVVSIGNMIDEADGGCSEVIKEMEDYCEILFSNFERLEELLVQDLCKDTLVSFSDECRAALENQRLIIKSKIKEQMAGTYKVVFIPYKFSTWKAMEPMWREYCLRENTEVYVMPVPYLYRNGIGEAEVMNYDGSSYPENIPIVKFSELNLEEMHPDEIIIQSAYDEKNFSECVYPYFFSDKIREYTEKLVYFPWFRIDELTSGDDRARTMMKYFVTVPGVFYSDEILVQSEGMRREYISKLVEFAGEETRGVWENKIKVAPEEYLKVDDIINKEELACPEWINSIRKADGSFKKVVLFSNGLSTLLENEDLMLKKIQRVLKTFEDEQKEIALIWKPQTGLLDTINSINPVLWEKYNQIVESYIAEGWGIYDDSTDTENVTSLCDAYYGDSSVVAQLCRKKGKPVMIENVFV